MRRGNLLTISVLLSSLVLVVGCSGSQRNDNTKSDNATNDYDIAKQSKEIVAQNVLGAQLARHNEIESRTAFAPTETIYASVYLRNSQHVESRRISAFLLHDEKVIEEQSIDVSASEARQEFDFSFTRKPRPLGAYQIKFVEVKRSNGKPVLLARLFLQSGN